MSDVTQILESIESNLDDLSLDDLLKVNGAVRDAIKLKRTVVTMQARRSLKPGDRVRFPASMSQGRGRKRRQVTLVGTIEDDGVKQRYAHVSVKREDGLNVMTGRFRVPMSTIEVIGEGSDAGR